MYCVELYAAVRLAVVEEGLSHGDIVQRVNWAPISVVADVGIRLLFGAEF